MRSKMMVESFVMFSQDVCRFAERGLCHYSAYRRPLLSLIFADVAVAVVISGKIRLNII